MICLCAIIFHGNVFGDDSDPNCTEPGKGVVGGDCVQCGDNEYSFTIPESDSMSGGTISEHNICVSKDDSSMTCDDTNKVCTCNAGYETVDDSGCSACSGNTYSEDGKSCVECNGIIDKDGTLNVGCTECGDGKQPTRSHDKCVCAEGYGLVEGKCELCSNGKTSVESEDGGYECTVCETGVPQQLGNIYSGCVACSEGFFPDETHTKCVQSCSGDGIGKFTEDGVTQCVKCSTKNMTLSDGVCVSECLNYKVKNNGECGYCEDGKVYDMVTKDCIDSCPSLQETDGGVLVCCEEYKYFDQASEQCKSCADNQYFDEGKCHVCPKNFSCDGKTKTRCPYGTTTQNVVGECSVPTDIKGQGFLYEKEGYQVQVIDDSKYESMDNDDIQYFKYDYCNKVNGYSETGTSEVDGKTVPIQTCHTCDTKTQHPVDGTCVCGRKSQKEGEQDVGVVSGIGKHKDVCQICPNGLSSQLEIGNYVCNGCPDTTPFYHWDGEKYTCEKTCPNGTALYTDKNGYGWCLTHEELKNVIGDEAEANRYYKNDNNSWELCPAGYCCLDGKDYQCNRGTFSLYEGGLACQNEAGICVSCDGKTTANTGTFCTKQYTKESACKPSVCTESITPTTFCIGENYNENMCFNINNIKMTLASGVYNTKDVTGQ